MPFPVIYPEQVQPLAMRKPQGYTQQLSEGPQLKQPSATGSTAAPTQTQTPGAVAGPTFADHLEHFVSGIDQRQKTASHKAEEFAVGHHNDVHGTMIAAEQAEISLHLLANVRNRVVDFYREVMRMGS